MSTPHLEIDPRLPIVPARLEGGISFFRDMENVTFKEDRDSWLSEERRRRGRRVSTGPGFTSTYSNQRRPTYRLPRCSAEGISPDGARKSRWEGDGEEIKKKLRRHAARTLLSQVPTPVSLSPFPAKKPAGLSNVDK